MYPPTPIKRGDTIIESSLYDRYAGELQIALQDMDNSGKTSVVGKVCDEEVYLLDHVRPWQKFKFKENMR
ncbi:phospho-sugar glycosidase domain-containing protein [Alkaliphilus metalliredigens]|uniref:phospho-sugar glycosidase domain-containing protein n=1 Tax=Alkaliphilus metalliredigens TaxID=208226 RepID=UPI00005CA71F|nr:phospho-sugar glycosidase domain-containing protein [Alkaliphilus metalliredigens]